MDTGAAFSVLPYLSPSPPTGPILRGPNSVVIPCWGEHSTTLLLGSHRFPWTFLRAAVDFAILGVDFLSRFQLLVDAAGGRLVGPNGVSISCSRGRPALAAVHEAPAAPILSPWAAQAATALPHQQQVAPATAPLLHPQAAPAAASLLLPQSLGAAASISPRSRNGETVKVPSGSLVAAGVRKTLLPGPYLSSWTVLPHRRPQRRRPPAAVYTRCRTPHRDGRPASDGQIPPVG